MRSKPVCVDGKEPHQKPVMMQFQESTGSNRGTLKDDDRRENLEIDQTLGGGGHEKHTPRGKYCSVFT